MINAAWAENKRIERANERIILIRENRNKNKNKNKKKTGKGRKESTTREQQKQNSPSWL
jgi:hypothetical protein